MASKTLMIQGTGSGVGKSVITAALCRYFFLKGRRVAPFKAQNMSLNSFVTREGEEMGRAQAYQAEACGLTPEVAMNPILLKPSGDTCSQVIVMGRVRESLDARTYFSRNGKYKKEVFEAFKTLRENHDLVILEGAGSPAEINLRKMDLVNMPMAEMADAPVLIVGDIDKGGVFAWMKGTFDLLTVKEQARVRGFIINKFRGDLSLLKPGLVQFEALVKRPVLGVIPFCRELVVDEEDEIPCWSHPAKENGSLALDVAVIRLPRISNFTDVTPLSHDPSVSLRYVTRVSHLGGPDLIILPGSKNTIEDLQILKTLGLDAAIRSCHESGTVLLGICGGLQMLGKSIRDPRRVESGTGKTAGLGLFELETTLVPEKITRQARGTTVSGPVFPAGLSVEGYEIHMGITKFGSKALPLFAGDNGDEGPVLGITNSEGSIIGTYVHGVLDNNALRNAFLRHVRTRRGLPVPEREFDYRGFRTQQLDRLTHLVSGAMDMNRLCRIIDKTEE